MDATTKKSDIHPRIESLKVQNFRVLRDVEFNNLTPLTVLLGPNGSGKSTVFDVFAFLSEIFQFGLRSVWDRRGGGKEIKTRGESGPVAIQLKYREQSGPPLITYRLAIDEEQGYPVVISESLWWREGRGWPSHFLHCRKGRGWFLPDKTSPREDISLQSPDLLAANALGQFAHNHRIATLRNFIASWYLSRLSAESARSQTLSGPQEHLNTTGDNLANVVQFLRERHPDRLKEIVEAVQRSVPNFDQVTADAMPNGQLLLQVKDVPFHDPVPASLASDGTLKLLAYFVLLHDPDPPPFIGIEEPENFLHHRLLYDLAETFRIACQHTQLFATTHSPFFLNALYPEEVRVLWRDKLGYARTERVADLLGVPEFMKYESLLGHLWSEGHFRVGDPLVNQGEAVGPLVRE